MAFLKFIRHTYAAGRLCRAGEVVEIEKYDAAYLVGCGKAVEVTKPAPPAAKKEPTESKPKRGRRAKKSRDD